MTWLCLALSVFVSVLLALDLYEARLRRAFFKKQMAEHWARERLEAKE